MSCLLGADRDLQRLVEGPAPGRGRPLQVARRRGLAYWVALALLAAADYDPLPAIPLEVTAHWRRELSRLADGPTLVDGDAPDQELRLG